MAKPASSEFPKFYVPYIDRVESNNLIDALKATLQSTPEFIRSISSDKEDFRYAENKWTVKNVIAHMMDTESIMAYRALCIARNDATDLPGFEEGDYAQYDNVDNRSLESLASNFYNFRISTIDLFSSFSEQMLKRSGTANSLKISVLALGYIIAGHELHHLSILKERYL